MLTPDHIKPFLTHSDPDVRKLATDYFTQSWSQDPDILPMILDACERYGFEEDLPNLFDAGHLAISESSLDRLLGLLAGVEDSRAIEHLNRVLAHTPGEVLRARREEIERHPKILPEYRRRIRRRQDYLDWDGERLWDELRDFAHRSEDKHYVGEIDHGYADDLVDALGRHEVPDAGTICRLLEEMELEGWLGTFLVDLAGRRRLREAVPILVDKFEIDTDYLLERTSDTLARIGDPEAVRLIRRAFPDASFHFRLYTTSVLGNIKHPESEAALLELLGGESDESIRMWICAALCDLVSERSVDVVRPEIASGFGEAFWELCSPVLSVITILGIEPPPESEVWERERERQRIIMKEILRGQWSGQAKSRPAARARDPLASLAHGEEPQLTVTAPIRKAGQRVGRNDPCPCGSGKKYKKCCGRSG